MYFFFCGSQSKSYSYMKAEPRSKQNGGGGGKGRKAVRTPHPLPHHFLFHPWFSFRVAESLNTLRTTTKKPASYAGYPENFSDELNMSGNEHRDVPFKFRALPPTPPFTSSYSSSILLTKTARRSTCKFMVKKFTDAEKFVGSRRQCSTYFK